MREIIPRRFCMTRIVGYYAYSIFHKVRYTFAMLLLVYDYESIRKFEIELKYSKSSPYVNYVYADLNLRSI